MPLRPIYYDTETTGVKPDKDRIIEIAAYDPVLDRIFEKMIHPGIPIPPDATAIHHITDAMVANAPSYAQVGAEFIAFCSGDVVLIAHNNDNFDLPFIRNEFDRNGLKMPSWKFLDTLKWARRYRSDLPRHTLQFLREMYGIPPNNAHRALDDVVVLHKIFSQMIDDLPIDKVFNLLNAPRLIRNMPFGKHQGMLLDQIPRAYIQWLASSGSLDKAENQPLKESFLQLGLLEIAGAA